MGLRASSTVCCCNPRLPALWLRHRLRFLIDTGFTLIHYGTLLVQHKMVVGDILRMTFAYPTFSEVYKIAALSFKRDVTKLSCCAT